MQLKKVNEDALCGLCADPLGPQAVGVAIQYLINNPGEAESTGENGCKAVQDKYNWPKEGKTIRFI